MVMTFVKFDEFMKVSEVLEFLNIKGNALTAQYTITNMEGNFFKVDDLKKHKLITPQKFREMECEVTTYMIEAK